MAVDVLRDRVSLEKAAPDRRVQHPSRGPRGEHLCLYSLLRKAAACLCAIPYARAPPRRQARSEQPAHAGHLPPPTWHPWREQMLRRKHLPAYRPRAHASLEMLPAVSACTLQVSWNSDHPAVGAVALTPRYL